MLISYSRNNGIATKIWLVMSGDGVITAATIRMMTMECRRYLRKNGGETMPNLDKKKIATGSSKTNPEEKESIVTVEINELRPI